MVQRTSFSDAYANIEPYVSVYLRRWYFQAQKGEAMAADAVKELTDRIKESLSDSNTTDLHQRQMGALEEVNAKIIEERRDMEEDLDRELEKTTEAVEQQMSQQKQLVCVILRNVLFYQYLFNLPHHLQMNRTISSPSCEIGDMKTRLIVLLPISEYFQYLERRRRNVIIDVVVSFTRVVFRDVDVIVVPVFHL